MDEEPYEEVTKLLHKLLLENDTKVDKVTDCLRTLRNRCADNALVQTHLGKDKTLLSDINLGINKGLDVLHNDQWTLYLRICCQFLGNFVVNNPVNQRNVWEQCNTQIKRLVQVGDEKVTYVCLMIIYNIVLGCPDIINDIISDVEGVKAICDAGAHRVEFAQFLLEHILTQDVDWSKIYNSSVSINGRLFLLDIFEDVDRALPTSLICQLAHYFCHQSDCILRTVADHVNSLEPEEVSRLLKILASNSPTPPHLAALQQDRSLFINCAYLLKSIHMAGKEQNNCFTPVAKLADSSDQLNQHPAFQFKANLVRMLGNLCYKHQENQDLIRELDIIPVILDCCNIDARNPFIIQWVVLAVKHLCENNDPNQSVIASLTREGFVQSAVLTEMGICLSDDGENNLNIAPMRLSN